MLASIFKNTPFHFVLKHGVAVCEIRPIDETEDIVLALLPNKFSRNTCFSVTVT